jgi:hypothetical protein
LCRAVNPSGTSAYRDFETPFFVKRHTAAGLVSCQTCECQVHHNLYPLSIKLLEGEPLRVVATRWTCAAAPYAGSSSASTSAILNYLSGEMMVGSKLEQVQDLDLHRPANFEGKVLRLH